MSTSAPGWWLVVASAVDVLLASFLALTGWLSERLPIAALLAVALATMAFALALDSLKLWLSRRWQLG